MSRCWYSYQGGTGFDPWLNTNNYAKIAGKPWCSGTGTICAIYAKGCGAKPDAPLSVNMQNYINNTFTSNTREPVAPNKPYVYVKAG